MALSVDRGTTHVKHHIGHDHGDAPLLKALIFTLGFACIEAVAGVWSGSLALISDAGHMVADSMALGLAALAAWLARKPPSRRYTYGLVRLEILTALINSLLMLGLIGFIVSEAIVRLQDPQPVQGGMVMVVAAIGLGVNLIVAWMLHKGGDSLNIRAAFLHVLGDLLGSVAALLAGAVIWTTGYTPIDPILSLVVAGLILTSALRLLWESLHALLEAVPAHIDVDAVAQDMTDIPGVQVIHDLHIWTLSSGQIALSAHLELASFDDWDSIMRACRQLLDQRHGIRHVTLQPEQKFKPSGWPRAWPIPAAIWRTPGGPGSSPSSSTASWPREKTKPSTCPWTGSTTPTPINPAGPTKNWRTLLKRGANPAAAKREVIRMADCCWPSPSWPGPATPSRPALCRTPSWRPWRPT